MEKIDKAFILDALDGFSTTDNIGDSSEFGLDYMKKAVQEGLVLETGKPEADFDFGDTRIHCEKPLHLDEHTIPTMFYHIAFIEPEVILNIECKHYSDWIYYVRDIFPLEKTT